MKLFISTLIVLNVSAFCFTQSKIEPQIQLLTSETVAQGTIEQEPFFAWVKKVMDELEGRLEKEKGDKELIILFTLRNDRDVEFHIGSRPEVNNKLNKSLSTLIFKNNAPRVKNADFSFLMVFKINNGCNDNADFKPEIQLPLHRELEIFQGYDLRQKKESMISWMKTDILPLLAYYENKVDPQFDGVLSMGKILKSNEFETKSIEELTDKNYNYWRATMEMSVGNQLIPFTKICLLIANGEFDKARNLMLPIQYFSEDGSLPDLIYEELSAKLQMIYDDLTLEINKGIALHDEGKFEEAIQFYNSLLKIIPSSAWLNYELYLSKSSKDLDPSKMSEMWNESKTFIYACDPMYDISPVSKSSKDAYIMLLRMEIKGLFKIKENSLTDMVRYADIALELGNFAIAGQLYWIIASTVDKAKYGNRELLNYYLYCMHKLEQDDVLTMFKVDYSQAFAEIEKELDEKFKGGKMFESFEKKE